MVSKLTLKGELKVSEKRQVENIPRKMTCAKAQIQESTWSSRKLTAVGVRSSKEAVEGAGVSDRGGGQTLYTTLRSFVPHRDVSCTFVCPMHRNWNVGVWSREVLLPDHARRQGAHALKVSNYVKSFGKALWKAKWGREDHIRDQLLHDSLIGWWWSSWVASQGLALSVLRLQEAWGCVLMVINYQ